MTSRTSRIPTAVPGAIHAVIVDDDESARVRLRDLLARHPDVSVVAECSGGEAAIAAVAQAAPNLVFLDVEMPDVDGFGVIARVGAARMPPTIFTSAYSQYAVRAFEAYALDYLLKPFDGGRLAGALDRARLSIGLNGDDARITGLLGHLARRLWDKYPDSIAIRTGERFTIVPLSDVDWIEADGNYSRLYVARKPRMLTRTLSALEKEVLDPDQFIRVHRSAIVNRGRVASLETDAHGDATLLLHDGTQVPCSRRYRERLERRIYFSA